MSKLTAKDVMQALRERYPPPAYALLEQVRNATGYGAVTRTADAMAMSLYPSRGLELHGFEVKVERGDWLRELKDAAKADELARYCDRWWVVVGDSDIVREGELPPTWGLLVPRGRGLMVKVDAPALTPEPLDRRFIASLLRNTHEHYTHPDTREEHLAARVSAAVAKAREEWSATDVASARSAQGELARFKASLAEFERMSGIRITEWDGRRLGEAVHQVIRAGPEHINARLVRMVDELKSMTAQLERAMPTPFIEELSPIAPGVPTDDAP